MLISREDAPKLENTLHRALHQKRLNEVNLRKEFFDATINEPRQIVEANYGEVDYMATPGALEHHESLAISPEKYAYVSEVMEELEKAGLVPDGGEESEKLCRRSNM